MNFEPLSQGFPARYDQQPRSIVETVVIVVILGFLLGVILEPRAEVVMQTMRVDPHYVNNSPYRSALLWNAVAGFLPVPLLYILVSYILVSMMRLRWSVPSFWCIASCLPVFAGEWLEWAYHFIH